MKVKAALRQERRFLNLDFSDAQRGSKSVRLNSVDQRKGASKSISCIYAPPLLRAREWSGGTEEERGEKSPARGSGAGAQKRKVAEKAPRAGVERGHRSGKLWKKPRAWEWSGAQKRKEAKKPRAQERGGGTKAESCGKSPARKSGGFFRYQNPSACLFLRNSMRFRALSYSPFCASVSILIP